MHALWRTKAQIAAEQVPHGGFLHSHIKILLPAHIENPWSDARPVSLCVCPTPLCKTPSSL
jgi:hypothetical protein